VAVTASQPRKSAAIGVVTPRFEELRSWINERTPGSLRSTPIWRDIVADVETPVSAYLKIAGERPACMLESIEGGERLGRYSFLGAGPLLDVTMNDSVGKVVQAGETSTFEFSDPLTSLGEAIKICTV